MSTLEKRTFVTSHTLRASEIRIIVTFKVPCSSSPSILSSQRDHFIKSMGKISCWKLSSLLQRLHEVENVHQILHKFTSWWRYVHTYWINCFSSKFHKIQHILKHKIIQKSATIHPGWKFLEEGILGVTSLSDIPIDSNDQVQNAQSDFKHATKLVHRLRTAEKTELETDTYLDLAQDVS